MEENQNGKGIIIILLVFVLLVCFGAGIYGYLNRNSVEVGLKDDIKNNKEKGELPSNIENNFEKVGVSSLNDKLNNLNFENKNSDTRYEEDWVKVNSKINAGKVTISIKLEEESSEVSYTIDEITNAISVGTGISVQENGSQRTYILTSDGKVYYVEDDFYSIKSKVNYKGTLVDTKISGATAIAVVDENFSLSDISESIEPTVYIKTAESKVYTDELLLEEQDGLVLVYEQ